VNSLTMLVFSGFWATNLLAQAPLTSAAKSGEAWIALPDSPARQHFKALSKNALKESALDAQKDRQAAALKLQNNSSMVKLSANENIQRLEEIRVLGTVDPEDYVAPKPPPMLVFRATLDKQRPRTIADTLRALCLICPIAAPREGNILDRTDERKGAAPARMSGTLQ
jgi:hypothetical protein